MIKTLLFDRKSQSYRNINIDEARWKAAIDGNRRMQKFICVRFRRAAGCGYVDFGDLERVADKPESQMDDTAEGSPFLQSPLF